MPIIFVLSLTDTNMIFAIPKPPTSIENPPITQPPILIPAKTASNPCDSRLALFTEKLVSFHRAEVFWLPLVSLLSHHLIPEPRHPGFALIINCESRKSVPHIYKGLAKFKGTSVSSSIPLSLIPPFPSFLKTPITLVLFPDIVISLPTGSAFFK